MKRIALVIAMIGIIAPACAQVGVTVVPYFWSTSFRSDMYSRTNGYGNVPLGLNTVVNVNNRMFFDFTTFRMMGEKKETWSDNFGQGVPNGTTHRNFCWTEFHFDYAIAGKKWRDMEKWAPAIALRVGVIYNSRMTMLAPQVGEDSVWTPNPPNYWTDSIVPLNRFDLTGLRQWLYTAGISVKIMHTKEIDMSSGFVYYKNIATGAITAVSEGTNGGEYYRVRQWDFYADFLYAPVSTYDGYMGWNDHHSVTRAISGDAIPGKDKMGWRWGIRHLAFNPLGLQWVIEYMQLPGQKRFPDVEDLDEPVRKNRYFMIGLNVSLGFNAGGD